MHMCTLFLLAVLFVASTYGWRIQHRGFVHCQLHSPGYGPGALVQHQNSVVEGVLHYVFHLLPPLVVKDGLLRGSNSPVSGVAAEAAEMVPMAERPAPMWGKRGEQVGVKVADRAHSPLSEGNQHFPVNGGPLAP